MVADTTQLDIVHVPIRIKPHDRVEVLVNRPDLSISDAIRHFIRTIGGRTTIRAFLTKYRWTQAAFKDEKRRVLEELMRQSELHRGLRL